jgi:hypothetical protein
MVLSWVVSLDDWLGSTMADKKVVRSVENLAEQSDNQ